MPCSCNHSTSEAVREDDLVIPQGETWGVQIPIVDLNGNPASLNGYTIKSQIRKNVVSTNVLHEWSTELGNAYFDANNVTLIVDPEVSSGWTWTRTADRFVYDVEITSPTGAVTRVVQGHIRISPEVTR